MGKKKKRRNGKLITVSKSYEIVFCKQIQTLWLIIMISKFTKLKNNHSDIESGNTCSLRKRKKEVVLVMAQYLKPLLSKRQINFETKK